LFQNNDNKLQITTQFLFGHHVPPYYSVLNHTLMDKYVMHLFKPNAPTAKNLRVSIFYYIIYFNKNLEIHNFFTFILAIPPITSRHLLHLRFVLELQ